MIYEIPSASVEVFELEQRIVELLGENLCAESTPYQNFCAGNPASFMPILQIFWDIFESVISSSSRLKLFQGNHITNYDIYTVKITKRKICIKGDVCWRDSFGVRYHFFQIDVDRRNKKLLYSIKLIKRKKFPVKPAIYLGRTNTGWEVGFKTMRFDIGETDYAAFQPPLNRVIQFEIENKYIDVAEEEDRIKAAIQSDLPLDKSVIEMAAALEIILITVLKQVGKKFRHWSLDDLKVEDYLEHDQALSLSGRAYWLSGGDGCEEFRIDIAKDKADFLYSFKFTDFAMIKRQSLFVGKSIDRWLIHA